MHYIMMVSENPTMIGECDLLIRSIRFFSKNIKNHFSIVLQGNETKIPPNPFNVKKIEIKRGKYEKFFNCPISDYLIERAEFYFCPQLWTLGMPCRWFVKPKSEMCAMIDVDMIACNDLKDLYGLNKNKIYGVKARKNKEIMDESKWRSIGFTDEDIQNYYINFGLVIVPSDYLKIIGLEIFENYRRMAELHSYFAGQLALAYSIKKFNLELELLPSKFNYYDLDEFPGRQNVVLLHLLENKGAYKQTAGNKYIELVQEIKKEIAMKKYF